MVAKMNDGVFLCLCCLAVIFLLQSPVRAAGHGPGSEAEMDEPLFADATACSRCHDELSAEGDENEEEDISFIRHWGASIMRFSFLDPFWRAKVRGESLRLPHLAGAIEAKCSRCHAPMANEQAAADGSAVLIFGQGGFADETSPYHTLAMEGVGCTLCHQLKASVVDENESSIVSSYVNSGEFILHESRVAFSKYSPDFIQTMERSSGFTPVNSDHLHGSSFCAVCHDLYTDYYDKNGEKMSTDDTLFPEQTPYQEWLASDFPDEGTQCQDCHMQSYAEAKISSKPFRTNLRSEVYSHTFFTENTMMLNMISSIADQQGLVIPDLDDAVEGGQEYLASSGGIEISEIEWRTNEVLVKIKVTNNCGHKLPTSIPVRRVFIHFAVYEEQGTNGKTVIFSSGDTDEEGGIIGVDDARSPIGYEPHYDEISAEDEVQVYEGVMSNWEGEVTYTLLNAAWFVKDNRLLPRGWNDAAAPLEIFPKGAALADANFVDGEDIVIYRVKLNGMKEGHVLTIEAELKDQTLSHPMVHDLEPLVEADETGAIAQFLDEYDHHKVHFEIIDSDLKTIVRPAANP